MRHDEARRPLIEQKGLLSGEHFVASEGVSSRKASKKIP